ncbi:MAG: amidohydrolase [Lentisphaerae bacterium]|nr:amidohydrolase [Lentisphaerota bacterium]HQL87747.1 M20 family metallopeptidase [Lentisphaeria bacterium]
MDTDKSMAKIKHEAAGLQETMTAIRRDLHRRPELGLREYRTTTKIREQLASMTTQAEILDLDLKTGVVAQLPGTEGKKTVALRADIDALAITETNSHSFASLNPGVMHACGHDGHTAMLLGAAAILDKIRPRHHVRFLFQPAEEGPASGARLLLEHDALKDVDVIFGAHLNATSDFGLVGYCDGPVMAGGLVIELDIIGQGGHAAYPDECANPLLAAAAIISGLAQVKDRLHASIPCTIVPTAIQCGKSENRIPDRVKLEIRSKFLSADAEPILRQEFSHLFEHASATHHARCETTFIPKLPVTVNDPEVGAIVRQAAQALNLPLTKIVPSMGSDDFAYYAQKIPAYYMTFGIRKGDQFPIAHNPDFDFDESILPIAAAQLATCAILY